MQVKPMSPQMIMSALTKEQWADERGNFFVHVTEETLRSSMQSLLLWMAEQMPEKVQGVTNASRHMVDSAYNRGIQNCISIILSKAKELC